MLDFSKLIYNWNQLSAKEKFKAVAKYQRQRLQKYKPKTIRPKIIRIRKEKVVKEPFNPPEGYYQGKVLAELAKVNYSTIKRYVNNDNVREYRVRRNVAYCLHDILIEKENAMKVRQQNGKNTGSKNKRS